MAQLQAFALPSPYSTDNREGREQKALELGTAIHVVICANSAQG